jgi:hypothetical protein
MRNKHLTKGEIMSQNTVIHEFEEFSVVETVGGDFGLEHEDGNFYLSLSPNGSSEHERIIEWIRSDERTAEDFEDDINEDSIC